VKEGRRKKALRLRSVKVAGKKKQEGKKVGIYLSLCCCCSVLVNFSTFSGRQKAKGKNLRSSCASTAAFLSVSGFQP
jgi:hypothetical protein